jgi:signal transduction histidine kinase
VSAEKRPRRRLRNRLMLAFAGFALSVAALFGLYAVSFMYATEDAFFESMLEQEAATQLRRHALDGRWAEPQQAFMRVYTDSAQFPADLAAARRSEPWRSEFAGRDGRHYHVEALRPPAPAPGAWLVAEVSRQLVVRPMRDRVLQWLGWSALAVVGLAVALGAWLARRSTAPLSRLAALVDTMAPNRWPQRIAAGFPDDEVGVLARGLEAMTRRTQAFIDREQAFTRDASHELRTPLAVIRSAGERLLAEPALSAAGREHLLHLRQSAWQLEQTVATLLTLAREAPPVLPDAPIALLPVLEQVVIEQAAWLEGKPVEVEVGVPDEARIDLPQPVLHILLSNLIGNAFAHTDSGTVEIGLAGGRLRIANRGHPIPAELRGRLHEPFRKREGSAGLGLGLAIVQRLCERYRVDLRLDEEAGAMVVSLALAGAATGPGGSPAAAPDPAAHAD